MRAALAVVAAAAAAFLGLWASVDRPVARPDTVAACDLRLAVERSWPDASAAVGRAPEAFQRITVLSGDGAVAASRGRPMDTDREAFRAGASSFDVVVGGQRVGVLRIADGRAGELARARRRVLLLAGGAIAAISLACLALHAFHRRRIARPFAALRAFAADVAAGNLDAPLTMDRGNLFGPFTEAFDIMRDELAHARRREEEAKRAYAWAMEIPVEQVAALPALPAASSASYSVIFRKYPRQLLVVALGSFAFILGSFTVQSWGQTLLGQSFKFSAGSVSTLFMLVSLGDLLGRLG